MTKVVHVLGNGDKSVLYKKEKREGTKLLCNLPPFSMDPKEVYATCMVDFKMMAALTEGSLDVGMYQWVLGTRPRIWMDDPRRAAFYLKYSHNIREFYTHVPDYAGNATNFNCGHMAVHYAASRHKADEIHMYGFDTLFDFNIRSCTDFYLNSDRSDTNNYRLINNWRPIWEGIVKEFPNTKFVMHHTHDDLKINKLDNIEIVTYNLSKKGSKTLPPTKNEKDVVAKMNRKQRRVWESQRRKVR